MIADRARLLARLESGVSAGVLAQELERSIERRRARERGVPTARFAQPLPVIERKDEIAAAIAAHRVVVVCGATGSGKTTQLPQICLALGRGVAGKIGHTQPRRIAARAVAARIAEELGVPLGREVGFKVRFGDETSAQTHIKLMTDGVLLAETQGDPDLLEYDTIIIDEAHERSLNIDFLLGYLRRLLERRADLKVIITSATIDPGRFARHFAIGGRDAPVIEVSGRTYPVEVRYRQFDGDEDDFEAFEVDAVADAVEDLLAMPRGDVLVFLPGEREIRRSAEVLRRRGVHAEVLPLFSRLTSDEQDRIFRVGERTRVILATNIAETSLTVPGIRYVVDTGLARTSRYDGRSKVQRLPVEPISRAAADQRAGRCGRLSAGVCVRLFSQKSYQERPAFTEPEVLRSNLAGVILRMKSLGLGRVEEFPFLDRPDARLVQDGHETLFELGAVSSHDPDAGLTRVGERLARLPVDPRIGRVLLAGAELGCLREALVLGAALSVQDPRERPIDRQAQADAAHALFRDDASDFMTLLRLWAEFRGATGSAGHGAALAWCREHFLSFARLREWAETHDQLRGVAEEMGLAEGATDRAAPPDVVHRALLTGLITNVACRDEAGGGYEYLGVRGTKCLIFPGSALFKKAPKWIMAAEVVETTRVFARTVAKIDPAWIEELAPHMFTRTMSDHHYDHERGEARAWERVTLAGLTITPRRSAPVASLDPALARRLFIREDLVNARLPGDLPICAARRASVARLEALSAKLRRRDAAMGVEAQVDLFESRLPASVVDRATFLAWLASASPKDAARVDVPWTELLGPGGAAGADGSRYPDWLEVETDEGARRCRLEYRHEPGKETDGVTVVVPLTVLPRLSASRLAWGVPGMLPELVSGLLKALPRGLRAEVEKQGPPAALAEECAGVMTFGAGELAASLSEAVEVLRGVRVPPEAWVFKGLPQHLVPAVRVEDDHGKELAFGRDVAELSTRLAGRIRRAVAGAARARFGRAGVTSWDFGTLPEEIEGAGDEPTFPAIEDRGDSVALTLLHTRAAAGVMTARGVRRLFAMVAAEEVGARLEALPNWDEMKRHYQSQGSADELKDGLTLVIAERAFMSGQPLVRSREEFEERQREQWGRLGQITIETAGVIAKAVEARFRIAGRISGGTPRLWAGSVADIREHAAYLMARGFLSNVPWERLRDYGRYMQAMRERLFRLREDGSGVEKEAMQRVAPHWKRFTGWVARAMADERARVEAGEDGSGGGGPGAPRRQGAPLPQARRAAPAVNLDAGEWALRPGALPPAVEAYRWALEEFRVAQFAPEFGHAGVTEKKLDELWARVGAPGA